ncbi:hypothetical protein ACQCVJ_22540 [Bacillus infantis]
MRLYKKLMHDQINQTSAGDLQQVSHEKPNSELTGVLTVCFGTDEVILAHRVNGRISYMTLGAGDLIELVDHNNQVITIEDVLETIVKKSSERHSRWNYGSSYYEGENVKVTINHKTTKLMDSSNKQYNVRQLFKGVEDGFITQEEALEIIFRWENECVD